LTSPGSTAPPVSGGGGLPGLDLALDLGEGISWRHGLAEGAVVLVALAGVSWTIARLHRLSLQARSLRVLATGLEADLAMSRDETRRSRADAERWREEARDLLQGLGEAIDRQLRQWALSPAEHEVALLLLKGLSHKEIAEVRCTGEATVRQQAAAIYRKANLTGRHDLAAFFLEDLLGPRDAEAHG
jgi:DNA-binding CsgD family transcriptional regulator